ncbi:hypothetical protein E4631_15610 [Hymenobacter sp. UV11]|uniref:hypothetical protein n=1 Tax=Hymenobacter sp. UV11 TaxID=1849735 RepID=UPI001061050A|nr:hypothetical protein [Hymenobacter sp. UV11]TDN39275.1 hypothetical protein A8B98_18625 [Hymenobacter sp. UV11]TFZ65644.1 hypothetical protein E4631_15610 [Hymenobacter sp. UV11]
MATTKTTPDAPAAAPAAAVTPSRAYLTATVSEDGELTETSRFKYLPGHPRQIRADLKAGVFNLNGQEVLGKSLTFIPVALRIFSDNILSMGRKVWAELFFIDKTGAVCAVLFHGYSVENLQKLNASLFYDDLSLTDVELTVTPVKKQTEKDGKPATYFIAEFSYAPADPAEVQARQEFAEDVDLYREETLTGLADMRLVNGYRIPEGYQFPEQRAAKQLTTAEAAAGTE